MQEHPATYGFRQTTESEDTAVSEDELGEVECFWYQDLSHPVLKYQPPRPAHIIKGTHVEENPAGNESDVYDAYCGESMVAWHFARDLPPGRGTISAARAAGYEICPWCVELYRRMRKQGYQGKQRTPYPATDLDLRRRCHFR